MAESGNIKSVFLSSLSVLKSTCRMVRLVPWYQTVLLSYQLVLKLAEILDAAQRKEVLIPFLYVYITDLFLYSTRTSCILHVIHGCICCLILCCPVPRWWRENYLAAAVIGQAESCTAEHQRVERWTSSISPSEAVQITQLPQRNWGTHFAHNFYSIAHSLHSFICVHLLPLSLSILQYSFQVNKCITMHINIPGTC